MARRLRMLVLLLVAALTLFGCGGGQSAEESTPTQAADEESPTEAAEEAEPAASGSEVTRADADLVIWADDTRAEPMRDFGEQFQEAEGITVAVQEIPFDDLRDQVQLAAPAGEGPDVFIGAHDWLGELVENGVVAPVDLAGREDEFAQVAIDAVTVNEQIYALPYSVENLALYRNTEFVPEAPATWEEVVEIATRLEQEGTVDQGLVVPESPDAAPYHNQPLFTALGGYLFGESPEGGVNPQDVGIDSPGGLAAATQFRDWFSSGLLDSSVDGALMQETFGSGNAAFAISGPWALVQDGAGFQETGVNFEVQPIPPVNGGTPRPFVSVPSVMVSSFSENGLLAQTFVRDFLGSEEAQLALFEANGRPPALTSAYEQVAAEDPIIQAFGEAGLEGEPIPSLPAMSTVFSALGDAYTLIADGGGDPQQAFRDAAAQVRAAVAEG